jgi:hypothetical protein
LYTIRKA